MLGAMGKKRLGVSLSILGAFLAVALFVAGCGSDSKPAYCSNVSELEKSVEEIGDVKLETGAIATLQGDLETVQGNADEVVSSAKEDFPNETGAVKSAVSKLSATLKQLPSSPTAQELLPLGSEISAVVSASNELSSATESACE